MCGIKVTSTFMNCINWTYISEAFPSEIKGYAAGFCISIATGLGFFISYLMQVASIIGWNPVMGPCLFSILLYPLMMNLPETL